MELTSTSFQHQQPIPVKYTCDGENISPQLAWNDAPEGTKSFALVCTDPDAPSGVFTPTPKDDAQKTLVRGFTHWIVYNIPSHIAEIQEGALPDHALQAENDFHQLIYGGPCPPSGTHRYIFTLYALSVPEINKNTRGEIVQEIEEGAIEHAVLIGLYARPKPAK